eukprot:TRINITY_DN15766_c0_g1_i1.p1 TRINITY_DN15766_c0_g1~~TRINITY_DN15766_c0_g1_i1.p1  ORF type:complete len:272 (+),score=45.52 TRINITY_DN15766_c0_g1_i1:790-1605(+)
MTTMTLLADSRSSNVCGMVGCDVSAIPLQTSRWGTRVPQRLVCKGMALTSQPTIPQTFEERESAKRVIVVIEMACLETVKAGKNFQLLNCDDHITYCRKHNRDPNECRPDITHQCLLTLMDSPLNKAGLLQVYIHSQKGVLIEINPHTRIPRTFKRFCGLMVQLLHKLSIRATNGPDKLLRVIKNPVTSHLPSNCRKIGTSHKAKKCVEIADYVQTLPKNEPIVFVVGGLAHGKVEVDYVDEEIGISHYPLSASVVCSKITNAFERMWDVL